MKQAKNAVERHVIWSDMHLDLEDWRDFLTESYPELSNNESKFYELMHELNADFLNDERRNLDIPLSQPILVIGDLGLWHGRVKGCKLLRSGNIRDCLFSKADMAEWYVDRNGDLRADAIHHDGTNHYLYRVFKNGVSEAQMDNLCAKICQGQASRADITRTTRRLGDYIAAVYGFEITKQRTRPQAVR